MDITKACNLRCRFCVQDWKQNYPNVFMTRETFANVVKILPLIHPGWLNISCGFESTIHPNFFEFMESIPFEYKNRIHLTTNLSKKFDVCELERLSNLPIDVLNISFESFNREIYEELRHGSKFTNFITNLENLTRIFKANPNAPEIHYISLVFKQNIAEIPDLITTCFEKYHSKNNEIRTPFPWSIPTNDKEWMDKSLLTDDEWQDVVNRVELLSYNVTVYCPAKDDLVKDVGDILNLNFFLNSDGSCTFIGLHTKYFPDQLKGNININDMDDPYNYLKDIFERVTDKYNLDKGVPALLQ